MIKKYLLCLIVFISWEQSSSQEIKNIQVIYNKHMKSMLDKSDTAPKQMKDLSYALKASAIESEFSLIKTMSMDNFSNKRFVDRGGGSGVYYKNIETQTKLHQKEFGNRLFLISQKFNQYKWTISKETKIIGNYQCYKATAMYSFYSKRANQSFDVNIIAWFSPQIPLPFGPSGYDGLPGLVLEAQIGGFYFVASKITINDENLSIEKPIKGKQVSYSEYDKIVEKVIDSKY